MVAGSNAPRCLISGGSKPLDKGRGGSHLDPEIRRGPGLQKIFCWPFGPQFHFGLKIRVGSSCPSPGSSTVNASESGLCSGNVGLIRWCLP